MQIKTVTLSKEYKCGLPAFSNITTGCFITWELAAGEEFNFPAGWDAVNQQLAIQGNDTDQSWMKTETLKNSYKTVIRTPKQGPQEEPV